MTSGKLGVWLGPDRIATLAGRRPWALRCLYEPEVLATKANQPMLSCSLPVTRASSIATPWVRGLLPEGNHLLAMATLAKVPTNYYIHLLSRFGRDITGAFTISEHPPVELNWEVQPYDNDELIDELRLVVDAPGFAMRNDSELSIAGLQNKLLVNRLPNNLWGRPVNGQPSTHILKLDDGRHPGLLSAEHACMELAKNLGLTTVSTELKTYADIEVLVVERYDRSIDPATGSVKRVHQEDMCQALGVDIDSSQGRGKYERFGGPSFAHIAKLLETYGEPRTDLPWLLRVAVFTTAIGNADGHGKNLSLIIDTDTGRVKPAPLYDTVPTALWPNLPDAPAMSINGLFSPPTSADFVAEAQRWGVRKEAAEDVVHETLAQLREAVAGCENAEVAKLVTTRTLTIARPIPG